MDVKIKIEMTPNPNAEKFITNVTVMNKDRVSYTDAAQCEGIALGQGLLALEGVMQIHFFENVITVTQDGSVDWGALEDQVKGVMMEKLPTHDPNIYEEPKAVNAPPASPEIQRINEILDGTVRPYLQGDGGDLEVLALEDNRLYVRYQGACGGCPSATTGTLQAIEGVLRDQFNSEIEVHAT